MTPGRPLSPDMPVLEAAGLAAREGLHIITDGRRSVLSRVVPPGWFPVGVLVRGEPVPSHGPRLSGR